jgi:hypothetical protein
MTKIQLTHGSIGCGIDRGLGSDLALNTRVMQWLYDRSIPYAIEAIESASGGGNVVAYEFSIGDIDQALLFKLTWG